MENFKNKFMIDPKVTFLNHGSFGAVPIPVFEQYQWWQKELERQPVEFLGRRAPELLENARGMLANYIGAQTNDIVFTTNVTEAINIVARSLKLRAGDEVLATNMEYGAMDRTWKFLSQCTGFSYINNPVTVPIENANLFVDQFIRKISHNTRVIFISHISSPTALITPIQEICNFARKAGILTIIDGAHAPGHVDLNLMELSADFYGANLHKWLCAPKGAGFLFARPEVQHLIHPLIVSWGWESDTPGPSQFIDTLQWTGTRDLSAYLSVPAAIRFQAEHNWSRVRRECHHLAAMTLSKICEITNLAPLYDPKSDLFGQMVACPLPQSIDTINFKQQLYERFRIEVPVLEWEKHKLIRVSFQAYNDEEDSHILVQALRQLI